MNRVMKQLEEAEKTNKFMSNKWQHYRIVYCLQCWKLFWRYHRQWDRALASKNNKNQPNAIDIPLGHMKWTTITSYGRTHAAPEQMILRRSQHRQLKALLMTQCSLCDQYFVQEDSRQVSAKDMDYLQPQVCNAFVLHGFDDSGLY